MPLKFSDSVAMSPRGTTQIRSLPKLCTVLHVNGESADVQRAAVAAWLQQNDVTPQLRLGIERRGWSDLLAASRATA